MTVQELISSGKLELYVAGVLSEREMGDIFDMAMVHPEVADEIEKIEQVMIEFLSPQDMQMTEAEKQQQIDIILGKVRTTGAISQNNHTVRVSSNGTTHAPVRVMPFSKWAVAALLVGLALTTGLTIWFGYKDNDLAHQVADLKSQDQNLASSNQQQEDKLSHMNEQVSVMRNILTKRIQLTNVAGNKITGQDNYMLVYWNPGTKKLMLADANLPGLSEQQQYQLWALYDGKPIDAGVFDVKNLQVSSTFQKDIPNAQAFAVTVEPKGGSKTPTLSNLCMLGKL
jgi:hypothetical protein